MCRTCGCDRATDAHHPEHDHPHEHPHGHEHARAATRPLRRVALETALLAKNDLQAEALRARLAAGGITALNLIGAPGAGKTTLLEHTLRKLPELAIAVIEGDQATDHDARRIAATGRPVLQVNTGAGCHLDADMIERSLAELAPAAGALVMIENVGNLVCPALFDLGEKAKVVVISVTEGEDKPLKYPHVFRAAKAMVLTKADLLPHLEVDVGAMIANARKVNPSIDVFPVSAAKGDGMREWCGWLRAQAGVAS
ncbi:MAG TPA: hydrogenase nickel incorporation protein HypB [Kofleriaceae bacterium]|nr:hydrogenase nickel incorporation protein HypB [Kofleriaceae bacterium]